MDISSVHTYFGFNVISIILCYDMISTQLNACSEISEVIADRIRAPFGVKFTKRFSEIVTLGYVSL